MFKDRPHRRYNPMIDEWVLVSPQRSKRPWQGKTEARSDEQRDEYEPQCYLCPGNLRAEGERNPDYNRPFVFDNDFAALLPETQNGSDDAQQQQQSTTERLFRTEAASGICKVIAFSPRHDLTLPELSENELIQLVHTWAHEFEILKAQKNIRYIQIFENKGEIMGCSNPHPHGQIWASSFIPDEIAKEDRTQKNFFHTYGHSLLSEYIRKETDKAERIVCSNEHFIALVPYWAVWPFETMIVSLRQVQHITQFTQEERASLAAIMKELTTRYDNVFQTSFPYSAGMHQAPVNRGQHHWWHWHMHFYPPLLRSATVKKFMVGYEMLAGPQRDITPEQAAHNLRACSAVHYKQLQIIPQ